MQSYNLDDSNEAESFQFTLGGHRYNFRYPTTEEVTNLGKLATGDDQADSNAVMQAVYAFITPEEDAPGIEEVLNKSSIHKFKAFQNMILKELGIGDA